MPISLPSARASSCSRRRSVVAELLERQVHGRLVVARVVLEAGGRLVGKLLRLDEVLLAEVGRVDPDLVRRRLDQALDQVRGLRDAERAAVGDAARRLVRVGAGRLDVRGGDVVGAGDDVEEARLADGRLRVGEERAVVGEHLHAQAGDLPALERQLAVHVVVAGEARRDEVSGAVLHPLDRPSDEERRGRGDDVAGVDRHLVPEAAAEVGRDDADLLLGQARDEGEERPVDVRSLRRHVDGRLPRGRVDVRDAAAALERRRVAARVERVELDDLVRLGEGLVRGLLVARLPVVDVVVGLPFLLVADDGRALLEGLLRGRDRLQRLVVDVDQLAGVLGDVGGLGDHRRHLLALEAHLVRGENGLRVAREGRHPGEVVLREELAGDDRDDALDRLGAGGVDRVDAGVRERAAQELQVEHSRQHDVVEVVALAADEAGVLEPLDGVPDAADDLVFADGHR